MAETERHSSDGISGWWVLAVLFVAALALGWVGFQRHALSQGVNLTTADLLYRSLQLFGMESGAVDGPVPWQLQTARFLAPLVTLGAALAAAAAVFREQFTALRLKVMRNHVVICGLGSKGMHIARSFRRRGLNVVAIELKGDKESVAPFKALGGILLVGNGRDPVLHRLARAHRARYVVVTTRDDSTNVEIASHILGSIARHAPRGGERPVCLVYIADANTCELFRQHAIFTEAARHAEVKVIHDDENAARLLFSRHLIERGPLTVEDRRCMHVILVDFGRLGSSALFQIANLAHYPNGTIPRVSVVAPDAVHEVRLFRQRYPALDRVCRVEAFDGDVQEPEALDRIVKLCREDGTIPSAVFCSADEHRNFSAALAISRRLNDKSIPVFIRLRYAEGLAELLHDHRSASDLAAQVEAFGLLRDTCGQVLLREDLDRLARVFHERYRAMRFAKGAVEGAEAVLQPWETLPQPIKEANRSAADHVLLKLRAFGYDCCPADAAAPAAPFAEDGDELETLARMEHRRWIAERVLAGWTYAEGPKDEARRTSPYLVPWEQLPPEIQGYDRDAVKSIPAALAAAGEKICRP